MSISATLTRKQLRELEAELRRERARLERRLESANGADLDRGDVSSVASTTYPPASPDGALGIMLGSRTQARYEAVVAALGRLESTSYGTCATCGTPIPYGRLLVMPEATQCVRCGVHG